MTRMSGSGPRPLRRPPAWAPIPQPISPTGPSGSLLAARWGVRTLRLLLLTTMLPHCLVPADDPVPNTDDPPRILPPGSAGSTTTPDDSVFLVTEDGFPIGSASTSVRITLDVVDDERAPIYARAFLVGPAPAGTVDAGVADAGPTDPFVRRFVDQEVVLRRDGHYRTTFELFNNQFGEPGTCYLVELRVSSAFAVDESSSAGGDAKAEPATPGDVAVARYWAAYYGAGHPSVDLSTCPVQP